MEGKCCGVGGIWHKMLWLNTDIKTYVCQMLSVSFYWQIAQKIIKAGKVLEKTARGVYTERTFDPIECLKLAAKEKDIFSNAILKNLKK